MSAPRPVGTMPASRSSGAIGSPPPKSGILSKNPSDSEISKFLANVPYFKDLPDYTLKKFSQRFVKVTKNDGEIVFEQDEPSDGAYVIIQGQIDIIHFIERMSVINPADVVRHGEKKSSLTNTDIFGELTLFNGERRTAQAISNGPSSLLKISQKDFRKLFDAHLELKLAFLRILVEKVSKCSPKPKLDRKSSNTRLTNPQLSPESPRTPDSRRKKLKDCVTFSSQNPLNKEDKYILKTRFIFSLARRIIKREHEIAMASAETKVAEAEVELKLSLAQRELVRVKNKPKPIPIYDASRPVVRIECEDKGIGGTLSNIRIKEINLRSEQASDILLLRMKIHSFFKVFREVKIPLSSCVKLLYATSLHEQNRSYFHLLKPVCDQYFTSEHEHVRTFYKALVIFKLIKKSPQGTVTKGEVKHVLYLVELLKKSDLFQISFAERLLIVLASEEVVKEANTSLYEKGGESDWMYFIESGSVKLHDGDDVIAEYGRGQCFGELDLLYEGKGKRNLSATTSAKSSLLKISGKEFRKLMDEIPSIPITMFNELSKMIKRSNNSSAEGLIPRVQTKDMAEVQSFKLPLQKLEKGTPLNEADVFSTDLEEKESNRLTKKELYEIKYRLSKLWENDDQLEKIMKTLTHIYEYRIKVSSSIENIKIMLYDIIRSYTPSEISSTSFSKIVINKVTFLKEGDEKKFAKDEFYQSYLSKAFPGMSEEALQEQIKILMNGQEIIDEESQKKYLSDKNLVVLDFLKAGTLPNVWSPFYEILKVTLLRSFINDAYKCSLKDKAEIDITTNNQEQFTIAITRKLVLEEMHPDPLKRKLLAIIPITAFITRTKEEWKLNMGISKDPGIIPGVDLTAFIKVVQDFNNNLKEMELFGSGLNKNILL